MGAWRPPCLARPAVPGRSRAGRLASAVAPAAAVLCVAAVAWHRLPAVPQNGSAQPQAFAAAAVSSRHEATGFGSRALSACGQLRELHRSRHGGLQRSATGEQPKDDSGELLVRPGEELPALLQVPRDQALWTLARPTIIIALLRTAYGLIDSIWVGRLGPGELQAMGASSFAFWVLLLLGEVASMGVHAVAAAREGAGERDSVGDAVVQGLWFSGLCGALALALVPLVPGYFRLLGIAAPGQVYASGSAYLYGLIWGVVPMTASGVLASAFKGVAELTPVLVVNAICVAMNFVLDPILIWGMFGFPAMGVAGAALATNICSLVATVVSYRLLLQEGVPLRWKPPHLKTLGLIAKIGLPISLGGLLFTAVYIVLGRILGTLGSSNLAALGLGHRVEALAFTVCEGFGAAAATIVGQWLGAGREMEARSAAAHAARIAGWVMLPVSALFLVWAKPIVGIFTSDPVTASAAASYLRITGMCFPMMGIDLVMDGALMAAGDTVPSLWIGLLFNVARIPLSLWLCARYGVNGVWAAISLSVVFKAAFKWRAFQRSRLPLLTRAAA